MSKRYRALVYAAGALILAAMSCASWALDWVSLYPGITSNAHYMGQPPQRRGTVGHFPTYSVGIVNEPDYFDWGGSTYMLPNEHPYYHYHFVSLGNGHYRYQFALGRGDGDDYDKLFFGFNDSLQRAAPIDSLTTARLNLVGAYSPTSRDVQRIVIGVGVEWDGVMHWAEVNPYAQGWDWCTTTNDGNPDGLPAGECDPDGVYDRRSYFGAEIVEYTVPGIGGYAELVPGGGWTPYLIDWGPLIRSYPWQHPPANWDDARLVGVYIGIESIGRTWSYLQVEDFATLRR